MLLADSALGSIHALGSTNAEVSAACDFLPATIVVDDLRDLVEQNVLFIDCQTTGPNPSKGHLLEIAWFVASAAKPPATVYSHLVKQPEDAPVPGSIRRLTGITTTDLIDARQKSEIREHLLNTIATLQQPSICLAHFARFERPFLQDLLGNDDGSLPFELVCTYEIAKLLFPNLPSKSIRAVAGYFGTGCGELKRAQAHATATWEIWRGLVDQLRVADVFSVHELNDWLKITAQPKKTKFQFPLDREKRLALPDTPGVYRMLNRAGTVLYVGKATSLKHRVNSYFRGNAAKDTKTKELTSQVFDLQVTTCSTPLEAALLETDEIKRLDPPYNRALKHRDRSLLFYSSDFASSATDQSTAHPIGPFANTKVLEPLQKLGQSLQEQDFQVDIFHREFSKVLLSEAFQIFCINTGLELSDIKSCRSLLAIGLWLVRKELGILKEEEALLEAIETTPAETADRDQEPIVFDSEEIGAKFERLLRRTGKLYLRSKALTKLLHSRIHYVHDQIEHLLTVTGGVINSVPSQPPAAVAESACEYPWHGLDVNTYDRMSVLLSGLSAAQSATIIGS